MRRRVYWFGLVLLSLYLPVSLARDTAETLYSNYKSALYQIKIIDNESGKKSTIGSGFLISADGHMVTNYHVVSRFINTPDKYRIEAEDILGNSIEASLLNFDVIHDLATIKISLPNEQPLYIELAEELPTQGSTIYSLGNPHDLGMIVVPGTYNGLQKKTFHKSIHFTGSVNSGMSGGPVVNEKGLVIGVNVASAGNQLGFLVPLEALQVLLDKTESLSSDSYKKTVADQLYANQQELLTQLTTSPWPSNKIGDALVPDAMRNYITCWGGSNADNDDALHLAVNNYCSLKETIFISDQIKTGNIGFNFKWMQSDKLSSSRFYSLMSQHATGASQSPYLYYILGAKNQHFTGYDCNQDTVVNQHSVTMKVSLCIRAYKQYESIYDAKFVAITLDKPTSALIANFELSGVSKESVEMFTSRFMGAIEWQ